MKKLSYSKFIVFISSLLAYTYSANAQSWLTAGNSVTTDVLGSTNAADLNFVTNGTTNKQMTILGSANGSSITGSVGFGNTAPGSWNSTTFAGRILHIKDNARTRLVLESATNPGLIFINSSSTANSRIAGMYVIGQELQFHRSTDGLTSTSMVNIELALGRVGINTSNTTSSRLEVLEGTNPQLRLTQASGTVYNDLQTITGGHLYINSNSTSGAVLIGTNTENGKLTVNTTANAYAGHFTSSFTTGTSVLRAEYTGTKTTLPAVEGINTSSANGIGGEFTGNLYGIHGIAQSSALLQTVYGVLGEAKNATNIIGIYGLAETGSGSSGTNSGGVFVGRWAGGGAQQPGTTYGVKTDASGATIANYGGYFYSNSANGSTATNYGVYAEADNTGATNYGLYATAPTSSTNYAGYFVGDVKINGLAKCTSGTWTSSDKRYKKNIAQLSEGVNKIMKLNAVTYEFKSEEFKENNFPKTGQIGFIAQELNEVIPEAVIQDSKGYYFVDYTKVIPVLTKAIQEQQTVIDEKSKKTEELESRILVLEGTINNKLITPQSSINTLSQTDAPFLSQNKPNPFNQSTTINYIIPPNSSSAAICIYDLTGKQLKRYNIDQRGKGNLVLNASEFNPGIFIYTLFVNGNEIASQKMILTDN